MELKLLDDVIELSFFRIYCFSNPWEKCPFLEKSKSLILYPTPDFAQKLTNTAKNNILCEIIIISEKNIFHGSFPWCWLFSKIFASFGTLLTYPAAFPHLDPISSFCVCPLLSYVSYIILTKER